MINSTISDCSEFNESALSRPEMVDQMVKESNYIKCTMDAFNAIQSGDIQTSIENYHDCLLIAKDIKDIYKKNDANCNYGTALFFNGQTKEAIDHFEEAYHSALDQYNQKNLATMRNVMQLMKIASNMTLAYLAVNKVDQSLSVFKKILEIINKESSVEKQMTMLKCVIHVFFRTESIVNIENYKDGQIEMTELDSNNETIHNQVINKIINSFHSYLRSNNIDAWIDCLTEECDHLKEFKDFSGLIFSIFNQQVSKYIKCADNHDGQGANIASTKLSALLKAISNNKNNSNDRNSHNNSISDNDNESYSTDTVIKYFKERIETSKEIYKYIYSKEKELKNQLDSDSFNNQSICKDNKMKQDSCFFVKLLLKYAISNIESQIQDDNIKDQMISQVKMTLDLINKNQIDLSGVKLSMLDPSIAKSLRILFDNLLYIYSNSSKRKRFVKIKALVKKMKLFENTKKLKDFFEEFYISIYNGHTLTKINMNTSGKKEHFYRLDYENDIIQIFERKNSTTPTKKIPVAHIKKIVYGVKTDNLRKKMKSITSSVQSYLFMSFVLRERTIDLFFGTHLKEWFYGMKYFYDQCKMKYKMNSTTGFVLERIKLIMASKISGKTVDLSFTQILLRYRNKT